MTASTMQGQGFAATHRTPIAVSAIGHILLLAAFSSSLVFMPDQPLQQLAIEAVVVAENTLARPDPAAEQRREERREQQRQAELEQQRAAEAEQRREQQLAAERQAEERREAEQQRVQAEQERREAEQAQQQEQQLRQQREAEVRAAEEQRQAEQRAAEARAAEEQQRREAEAAAQREQERRAAEERERQQAARREQERREAELAAMLAEEEALSAARNSDAMRVYVSRIASSVERKWVQPASAVPGVECQVSVQQLPNGEVVSARVTECNGDELVRRSVENAVLAASPLPLPDDRLLFDRNLRFTFRPRVGN